MITETDEDFRTRIINHYGMWGAFCSEVIESSGAALDDCGRSLGLTRYTYVGEVDNDSDSER